MGSVVVRRGRCRAEDEEEGRAGGRGVQLRYARGSRASRVCARTSTHPRTNSCGSGLPASRAPALWVRRPEFLCSEDVHWRKLAHRSIVLLLFLQKQNLATAIYLFGLGTLLTGLGLKHMRICSHHDLVGALVTSLFLGRPWWSTTSPTCLPLSVFTITSDQHRCRIPPLL